MPRRFPEILSKQFLSPSGESYHSFHDICGEKVVLDSDLARPCGTATKHLTEQPRRDQYTFRVDFAFQLLAKGAAVLRSQAQLDRVSRICISTFPHLYSVLRGEEIDPEIVELSGYQLRDSLWNRNRNPHHWKQLPPVIYHPNVPIETTFSIGNAILSFHCENRFGLMELPSHR